MMEIIKWYGIVFISIGELAHLISGVRDNDIEDFFSFVLTIPLLIYFIMR